MTTSNTIALLERGRERVERQSKRGLAIRLGMEDANLRRIYRGKGFPNAIHCERLAELIGLEPLEVIRYVQEDKAKSEADREFLRSKLPRLLPTTCIALAAIVGALTTMAASNAWESVVRSIHYANQFFRLTVRQRGLAGPIPRVIAVA